MLFPLGEIIVSRNARLINLTKDEILAALRRHQSGDWGEYHKYTKALFNDVLGVDIPAQEQHDAGVNRRALETGRRLMSIYRSTRGFWFFVATEGDRKSTTVLLPDEYPYGREGVDDGTNPLHPLYNPCFDYPDNPLSEDEEVPLSAAEEAEIKALEKEMAEASARGERFALEKLHRYLGLTIRK